jgi:methionine-rich copper-binding protein CopC
VPLCSVWSRRAAIAAVLLASLSPRPALAHAILEESEPAQGGTVRAGTVALRFRYNSRIDVGRSRLTVTRPDHTQATLAIASGGSPDIVAAIVDLTPGAYTVRWQVLAIDGHITRGDVRFTVTEP